MESSIHFEPFQALGLSLRRRGILGTLRHSISFAMYRWRSWIWDFRHHVETRKPLALCDLAISSPNVPFGRHYEATDPAVFRAILQRLSIEYERFTFIDFGSGKGRAVLLASDFPFARIIGLEFSSDLVRLADKNCLTYRSTTQKCRTLSILCTDFAEFSLPAEPLVLYFFDPLKSTDLMEALLTKIAQSAQSRPRPVFLIHYPAGNHKELFRRSVFLEPVSIAPRTNMGKYHLGWHIYKLAIPDARVSVLEEATNPIAKG